MIHYPAPVEVADSTSSSSLHPESVRRINSTPTLRNSVGGILKGSSRRGIRVDGKIGDRGSKTRKSPLLDRPSSHPPSDSRHPIIDISSVDYKAYRHRLIEATLKKQYDDFQPPGDVVLNSLHLNSADSVIGVRLNDRYDHSLFDFVEEYYDISEATSRRNVERPHPLDHFLSKGARRPRTSEKETETIPDDDVDCENGRNHLPENDSNPPKLSDMDDNGNRVPPDDPVFTIGTSDREPRSGVPISTRSRKRADKATPGCDVEDDCPRFAGPSTRKESWTRNDRPASAGSTSKGLSLLQAAASSEKREATGSPRPGSSTGRSREFKKKLADYPPSTVLPLSGKRRAEGEANERSNFISVSSSEIASIRSDSGKRRDDEVSCRSRESSISPRSRALSRPPWLSGNRGTSFNRKYGGNITEISTTGIARPTSARGSGPQWQKSAVSSRGHSKESPTASTCRNPALSGRRAASFVASRGKEFIGTTTGENLAMRPRSQRNESKDVGSIAAELQDNEEQQTLKTSKITDSPSGERTSVSRAAIPTSSPDNAALSFLSPPARTLIRPRRRSPRAAFSADAPAAASETSATKEPGLITIRSGADGAGGGSASGNNAGDPRPGPESPSARDRRENPAKLNRGGRRRLRSAENPTKGASLSPQIELSAEVLNPADDTDKSAIPDGEILAGLTSRIDPRANTGAVERSAGIRAEDARAAAATGNDVKSNSADGVVARSRVPKIIRNLRTRPASANNLPRSRGPAAASHPARWDANSETKSGLNDTRLNTRSNGAEDGMRYDESSPREYANVEVAKKGDIAGRGADEDLQLPRHDSKVGLAMNSALKRYIRMLKHGIQNHKDGVALASLSLSDAVSILSEQRTPLSPEETQELQAVLDKIERNPELLCKLSCPSMESVG